MFNPDDALYTKVALSSLNRIERTKVILQLAEYFVKHPSVQFTEDQAMSMAESAINAALKHEERN